MSRGQLGIDGPRRESLPTVGIGHAMRASDRKNHRVVNAIAGMSCLAAVDVADKVRIRVTPLDNHAIRDHRAPKVGILVRE